MAKHQTNVSKHEMIIYLQKYNSFIYITNKDLEVRHEHEM